MLDLYYFSSTSEMTHRFVGKLDTPATRLPLYRNDPFVHADRPFLLITPTYGDGNGRGAVPKQVIKFLNDPTNRALLRGVIGSGNTNFGATFALAGRVVAEKCGVPLLATFELTGMEEDVARVQALLAGVEPARTVDDDERIVPTLT